MFNFGEHLKEIRVSRNLTQKQLAMMVGSTERGIQRYESGERKPNFDAIIALCEALHVSADYLLGRTDNPTNYFKYHKIVMSYGEAEKYIKAGWCLESVQKVLLKGIDKEYEECRLVWKQEGEPIIPPDLD